MHSAVFGIQCFFLSVWDLGLGLRVKLHEQLHALGREMQVPPSFGFRTPAIRKAVRVRGGGRQKARGVGGLAWTLQGRSKVSADDASPRFDRVGVVRVWR